MEEEEGGKERNQESPTAITTATTSSTTITTTTDEELSDSKVKLNKELKRDGKAKSKNEKIVKSGSKKDIIYGIEEVPPWYLCILLGLQHYIIMVGSMTVVPFILTPMLCIAGDDPARGQIISTILFASGIITMLQTTIGVRLPIVQGATLAFLLPTIAILTTSFPSCNSYNFANMTRAETDELWMSRMREIQGDIIVSSLFQVVLGFSGAIGFLMTWISPLTIVPTITLVGLSLFKATANKAAEHWGIAALSSILMLVFSQYLADVKIPFPQFSGGKFRWRRFKIFSFFPVIMAIGVSWIVCAILTVTDALPPDSEARTDTKLSLIEESPWFYVPYPFQFGIPTVTVSGVFGMLAGVLSSLVESLGDYYACARLSGAKAPPKHAVNRGVGTEGLGCIIAGVLGTGNGTTSYSENIGAIRVTKVASRRVIQVAAFLMIICGVFGKFGAAFVTLPDPVVGGVSLVMCAIVTSVGLSNLQVVDLNSSRNLFVLGISLFFGIAIPEWVVNNSDQIQTGNSVVDQLVVVLLSTQMFVGGALGLVLDNTIPGTDEERGLTKWKAEVEVSSVEGGISKASCYDLPFGMNFFKSARWCATVPFSPTYGSIQKPEKITKNLLKKV